MNEYSLEELNDLPLYVIEQLETQTTEYLNKISTVLRCNKMRNYIPYTHSNGERLDGEPIYAQTITEAKRQLAKTMVENMPDEDLDSVLALQDINVELDPQTEKEKYIEKKITEGHSLLPVMIEDEEYRNKHTAVRKAIKKFYPHLSVTNYNGFPCYSLERKLATGGYSFLVLTHKREVQ